MKRIFLTLAGAALICTSGSIINNASAQQRPPQHQAPQNRGNNKGHNASQGGSQHKPSGNTQQKPQSGSQQKPQNNAQHKPQSGSQHKPQNNAQHRPQNNHPAPPPQNNAQHKPQNNHPAPPPQNNAQHKPQNNHPAPPPQNNAHHKPQNNHPAPPPSNAHHRPHGNHPPQHPHNERPRYSRYNSNHLRVMEDRGTGLYGYLGNYGRWVIPPKFRYAKSFNHEAGLAVVRLSNGYWGAINARGQTVIQFNFTSSLDVESAIRSILKGRYRGIDLWNVYDSSRELWGYLDYFGNWYLAPQFRDARDMSDRGFAIVRFRHGGWGAIDRRGQIVIEPNYNYWSDVDNELRRMGLK